MTVKEKAEKMFLDVLTRPSVTRTLVLFCQPFLSPSEQSIVLGEGDWWRILIPMPSGWHGVNYYNSLSTGSYARMGDDFQCLFMCR